MYHNSLSNRLFFFSESNLVSANLPVSNMKFTIHLKISYSLCDHTDIYFYDCPNTFSDIVVKYNQAFLLVVTPTLKALMNVAYLPVLLLLTDKKY